MAYRRERQRAIKTCYKQCLPRNLIRREYKTEGRSNRLDWCARPANNQAAWGELLQDSSTKQPQLPISCLISLLRLIFHNLIPQLFVSVSNHKTSRCSHFRRDRNSALLATSPVKLGITCLPQFAPRTLTSSSVSPSNDGQFEHGYSCSRCSPPCTKAHGRCLQVVQELIRSIYVLGGCSRRIYSRLACLSSRHTQDSHSVARLRTVISRCYD